MGGQKQKQAVTEKLETLGKSNILELKVSMVGLDNKLGISK